MKRNKVLGVGIAALLIVGLAWGINAATQESEGCPYLGEGKGLGQKGGFRTGIKEKLGLSEDATRGEMKAVGLEELGLSEDATKEEVMEAMFQKKLEVLGLTEGSTIREFRDAMQEQKLSMMREKLGLSEDATDQEIKDALGEKAFNGPKFRGGVGRKMGWAM